MTKTVMRHHRYWIYWPGTRRGVASVGYIEVVAVAEAGLADESQPLSIPKAYGDYWGALLADPEVQVAQLHAESFALRDQQGDPGGRQAHRFREAAGDEFARVARAGGAGEGGRRGECDQFQLPLHAARAAGPPDVPGGGDVDGFTPFMAHICKIGCS
jgi:hypothetical protein